MNELNKLQQEISTKKGSEEDPFFVLIQEWFKSTKNISKFKSKKEYEKLVQLTDFLPEKCDVRNRMWHVLNGYSIPLCKTCNNVQVRWDNTNKKYREYCSLTCSSNSPSVREAVKNTNMERYGGVSPANSSIVREKMSKSMEIKYGVKIPLQSDSIKNKFRQTIQEKYGVENISQSDAIKQKKRETTKSNYGVEYTLLLPEYRDRLHTAAWSEDTREKRKQTNKILYGKYNPNQRHISDENLDKLNEVEWLYDMHYNKKYNCEYIASLLGVDRHTVANRLKDGGYEILNLANRSSKEIEISEFISQYFNIRTNVRDIIDGELDIFVPELNIAFEYCGLYWHSAERIGKDYHYKKYIKCKEKNIRLIQIFEDEYLYNKNLVLDKIKNILGKRTSKIYARNCTVTTVDYKLAKQFLDKNHIQGCGVTSINMALLFENEIVGIASFLKCKEFVYEMTRYCSKNVIGGFSKIMKNITFKYDKIFTFADLRWSDGLLYEKNGFYKTGFIKPDYSYCKSEKRHHKFGFRKKLLQSKLKIYDENLSEYENCSINGYYRIYDAGKIKYQYDNSK